MSRGCTIKSASGTSLTRARRRILSGRRIDAGFRRSKVTGAPFRFHGTTDIAEFAAGSPPSRMSRNRRQASRKGSISPVVIMISCARHDGNDAACYDQRGCAGRNARANGPSSCGSIQTLHSRMSQRRMPTRSTRRRHGALGPQLHWYARDGRCLATRVNHECNRVIVHHVCMHLRRRPARHVPSWASPEHR